MDSWQSRQKNICTKRPNFFTQCPKLIKKDHFDYNKNSLSSEFPHGHGETRFENPAGKLLPESRNFFAQCPKTISKRNFLGKKFPPKCFVAHVECNFDNLAENCFVRTVRGFQSVSENDKKNFQHVLFPQSISLDSGNLENRFDNPAGKIFAES